MATAYYAPGVYIEEPDRGPKPIEGVSTSVTAFIGYTEKAEEEVENKKPMRRSILSEAKTITNWRQFVDHFGGLVEGAYLPYAVRGFFDNGGVRCYVISVRTLGKAHRAQALIEAVDEKTKKKVPYLFVRAKNGGPIGEKLQVDLEPQNIDTKLPNESTQFKLTVTGADQPVKLTNLTLNQLPFWDARDVGLDDIDRLLAEINKLEATAAEKADEIKAKAKEAAEAVKKAQATATEMADAAKKAEAAANDAAEAAKRAELNDKQGAEARAKTAADTATAARAKANDAEKAVQEEKAKATQTAHGADPAKAAKLKEDELNTTFARILGAAFDRDVRNDKVQFSQVKETYKQLSQAGLEIWRGVETNRPLRLTFAPATALLMIDGSRFNVDEKLLVADEDKAAREKAKEDGTTLDMVRPEQYRGSARKGFGALEEKDDVNLVCAPDLMTLWDGEDEGKQAQVLTVQKAMIEHCERMQFRFAILDAPPGKDPDQIKQWRLDAGFDPQHGHAALYYPWLKIDDPLNPGRKKAIPPSGHIAGIYSRSDNQRGVHKAPANETVSGVIDLEINVNLAEQGMLNPIGINCIRKFPGRGIRVWGARTLALTDPSWRYINVRRLFNYVEASIERATQWVVFEPNDPILWGKIRRDVNSFLRTVWLSGALFGNTPDEAFYVKCDLELNPPETRDLGYLFIEMGLAPVKPAEFVVFRISQWAGPNAEG